MRNPKHEQPLPKWEMRKDCIVLTLPDERHCLRLPKTPMEFKIRMEKAFALGRNYENEEGTIRAERVMEYLGL